jgi:hypothetical protein
MGMDESPIFFIKGHEFSASSLNSLLFLKRSGFPNNQS